MRKLLTALLLTLLLPAATPAQQLLKEAGLRYKITDTRLAPDGSTFQRSRVFVFSYDSTELRTRAEMPGNIDYISINNCNTASSQSYVSNGAKSYTFEDDMRKAIFEMGKTADRSATIRYTEERDSISGFACRKAVMTILYEGKAEEIEVWYTPAFRIAPGCSGYFFHDLEGLPVRIRFTYRSGIKIGNLNTDMDREYVLDTLYQQAGLQFIQLPDATAYTRVSKEESIQTVMEMYNNRAREVPRGKPITERVRMADGSFVTRTKYNPFTIGDTLAAFAATGFDGQPKGSATTYKDRPMVINFWFTRCAPCITEMPMLNNVAASYKDSTVSFVSITYSTTKEIEDFLKKRSFVFDHIADARNLVDQYGVFTYPATIITDRNHIVRYIKIGAFDSEAELTHAINSVLN